MAIGKRGARVSCAVDVDHWGGACGGVWADWVLGGVVARAGYREAGSPRMNKVSFLLFPASNSGKFTRCAMDSLVTMSDAEFARCRASVNDNTDALQRKIPVAWSNLLDC